MASEEDPLESLRERVYQQPTHTGVDVPAYSDQKIAKPYGWQSPPPAAPPKKRFPWTVWFLIAAGVFLVLAAAIAAFLVFNGTRSISGDRVIISAEPSLNIASGEPATVVITVRNENPATIKNVALFVAFPEGSKSADGSDADLTLYNDVLGDIPAGESRSRTVTVKLFGAENQIVTVPTRVEFHTDGSSALLVSKKISQ